jgi:hypothetical protein
VYKGRSRRSALYQKRYHENENRVKAKGSQRSKWAFFGFLIEQNEQLTFG